MGNALPASRSRSSAAAAAVITTHAVILRHDHHRRPFAPRRAALLAGPRTSISSSSGARTTPIPEDRVAQRVLSGRCRNNSSAIAAAAAAVVIVVDVLAAVEPTVDRALALPWRAVLAETGRDAALHEPYGVLDELHRRAEDLVFSGAVEVSVRARVRGVRAVARQVDPERVALWEIDELPWQYI